MERQIGTNEPTRYEVVATDGTRTILIGFTAQKSRAGGLALLTERLAHPDTLGPGESSPTRVHLLAVVTETDPYSWMTTARSDRALLRSGPWQVWFSGRTQREALWTKLRETIYGEGTYQKAAALAQQGADGARAEVSARG